MDIYDAIELRRSVRRFQPETIPAETLQRLVAAGAKAPTGGNQQGWVFVVVDDPERKAEVARLTMYGKHIAQAGACIAIFCNREAFCVVEDCSAAAENIMLAAVAEGLGTCWVSALRNSCSEPIGQLLGCPDSHELVALLAVGVPDGRPEQPEKKPLGEVLRWNGFGA